MELQNFVKRELSKTAHNADREKLIRWLMREDGTRWYGERVPKVEGTNGFCRRNECNGPRL
jgi:hypothetical protein